MARFVEGMDRVQASLLPECLEDWVDENNPVRAVDVFVDALDLVELGFDGAQPMATGRPGYKPSVLLKLYIYGYLNRVQSSRRLEREAGRNVEVMWLTGRLAPDHKTIADFRKGNGAAIRKVCARFVALCRARSEPHSGERWNQTTQSAFSPARTREPAVTTYKDYQKRAAECLRLAQTMNDPANKALLLEMARTWARLAEQAQRE